MLEEPRPRSSPLAYQPCVWPDGRRVTLDAGRATVRIDLSRLLENRETRRVFLVPPTQESLGEFLWLACRNRSSRPSSYGFAQESRVHPSAGGMHPIHVLAGRLGQPWMRYDPLTHELVEVHGSTRSSAAVWESASELLDAGHGMLLALVAEPGRTAAKYEHHESLVWRDAGVVLGYMSVVAEALELPFCPLGIVGQASLRLDWMPAGKLMAAGLALLGGAPAA